MTTSAPLPPLEPALEIEGIRTSSSYRGRIRQDSTVPVVSDGVPCRVSGAMDEKAHGLVMLSDELIDRESKIHTLDSPPSNPIDQDEKSPDEAVDANIHVTGKIASLPAGWDHSHLVKKSSLSRHEKSQKKLSTNLTHDGSRLKLNSAISKSSTDSPPSPSWTGSKNQIMHHTPLPSGIVMSSQTDGIAGVSSSLDKDQSAAGPASLAMLAAAADASGEPLLASDVDNIVKTEKNEKKSEQDNNEDAKLDAQRSRQEALHVSKNHDLHKLDNEPSNKSSWPPLLHPTQSSLFSSPEPSQFPDVAPRTKVPSGPPIYTFTSTSSSGKILTYLSFKFVPDHLLSTHGGSALAGFFALLLVTCANYMLGPMRDAAALAVGVSHIPALTLASTVLALGSSVPVGWLFEAPDPRRRRLWKRMGLTRGETQGTSLALFYRVFAFLLLSYAVGFQIVEMLAKRGTEAIDVAENAFDKKADDESVVTLIGTFFFRLMASIGIPVDVIMANFEQFAGDVLGIHFESSQLDLDSTHEFYKGESVLALFLYVCTRVVNKFGKVIYIMFFLVVHLMKLHSLSLIWGVTTEAMEYEENTEQRRALQEKEVMLRTLPQGGLVGGKPCKDGNEKQTPTKNAQSSSQPSKSSLRLKRLAFVGFGGTLGGITGSLIASFTAHILHLSGLLVVAAIMLEISANLSIELGRIMQRHWEEQMKYQSCADLASLNNCNEDVSIDSSMKKSASFGSMKRIASGNLSQFNVSQEPATRRSTSEGMTQTKINGGIPAFEKEKVKTDQGKGSAPGEQPMIDDTSFKQRLLRGITTILRSRLLMAIFTYNALYASTSVLLSFQRAELVANRSSSGTSAVSNTAFLAKINTASSVAVFALQASGLGAYIANRCGQRGSLALMPIIRLSGVFLLGWWHMMSNGQPPDLILFLLIDEFTKVINFAIAKPVRESLWRGLSAEARYEAKPIVDTLANRWGGGSAAFLVSFINRITDLTNLGEIKENGERSIFGFPPVLLLCVVISAWWAGVSADVGNIRRKIDLELKKQQ